MISQKKHQSRSKPKNQSNNQARSWKTLLLFIILGAFSQLNLPTLPSFNAHLSLSLCDVFTLHTTIDLN
jgi:hypothetical protein